jgi:hypothetical protein
MNLGDRIAVCFSGQIRTGVAVAPALKHFFGEMYPIIDFFVHTWTTDTVSRFGPRELAETDHLLHTPIDYDKIKQIQDFYQPKAMVVDNFDEYQVRYEEMMKSKHGVCYSKIPMLQTLYESNRLKSQYEQLMDSRYRLAIKLRLDQVFDHNHRLIDELQYIANKTNTLYVSDPYNKLPEMIEDIAWISSSQTMDTAAEFGIARSLELELNLIDWQQHMKQYLEPHKISAKTFKNNNISIYRKYHSTRNISPFDTKSLQ